MDIQISEIIVTLDAQWENKLDEAVAQLKKAGMEIVSADDDNSVLEGTIDACLVHDLQKLACVKYVRTVFTYSADFPAGDPRDRNGA